MYKITVKKLEPRILSYLAGKKKGCSAKELRMSLGVLKNTKSIYRKTINKLISEGKIFKTKGGKKYKLSSTTKNVTGELRIARTGFGFVHNEQNKSDIFIGKDHLNTAFDRDIVEVKLYARFRGKNEEGFVTRIIKRFRTKFVGTFHQTQYYGYVKPDDSRIYRDFFIPIEKQNNAKPGQKVLVSLDKWESDHLNPEATILEIIGYASEKGVDLTSVAYSFDLNIKFSDELLKEADQIPGTIDPGGLKNRSDFRNQLCFTIDPEDAKDFDDAISLKKLDKENYELGVHIADVSHFVKEGSKIDMEAYKRGTSIYLVDRVIPMLPEKLSNVLCSLQQDQDRLTLSCIMQINSNGDVIDYKITPSIICSKRRFNYDEVQDMMHSNLNDMYTENIKTMYTLSKILIKKRQKEGSIDFETPEVKFNLDENGFPTEIKRKERLDSHRLVEEFMLLANRTVARHVINNTPMRSKLPFIYRIHEKPDPEKMERFFNFLEALGFSFTRVNRITPGYFQKILNNIKDKKEAIVIEEVALRSMMKAVYSVKNLGHFGLAFKEYTHFTSPIRRYPDLVVHRLIKKYSENTSGNTSGQLVKNLKSICEQSTKMERNAIEAERESVKLKQNEYISRHIDEEYEGIISGVLSFGIFVELIDTLVEGLVHIQDMDDDYYIYDEKTYALIGRDTDKVFRLGDQVKIRVKNVNLEEGKVDFILAN